jgi:Flp pilus assembly protein TadD
MDVAPYYVMMSFTLKDSTAGIPSDAAKVKLKEGVTFAKANRMDRACPIWREAMALAPGSITLMYNVGICDETEDRPHEALALYQQIDRSLTSPDDLLAAALARVNAQIENRGKLAGQVAR